MFIPCLAAFLQKIQNSTEGNDCLWIPRMRKQWPLYGIHTYIYIYAGRNNFIWSTVWRVARGYYVKHNENKKIYCMGTYSASAASILPPKTNRAFMELNRIITYWHGGTELKLGKDSGLSWFLATALFIFLGFQSIQSFVGLSLFPCGIPGAF